jgi:hypothetical protein
MSREETEYRSGVRSTIVGGSGCVGGMMGGMIAVIAVATGPFGYFFRQDSVLLAVLAGLMGVPFGFFLGTIGGLLFLRAVRPSGGEDTTVSLGPQLVGQMCALCRKRIDSVAEGEFCTACGSPVHHGCVGAGTNQGEQTCSRCGGDPSLKLPADYHG